MTINVVIEVKTVAESDGVELLKVDEKTFS